MPPCADCGGVGYVVTLDHKIVNCHCFIEARNRRRMDDAGVPRIIQSSRIEDFFRHKDADHNALSGPAEDMKKWAREVVSAYIDFLPAAVCGDQFSHSREQAGEIQQVRGNTLLLTGGHRSGKSLLAGAIIRHALVEIPMASVYIEWPVLVDSIGASEDQATAIRGLLSPGAKLLIVENVRPDTMPDWIKRRIDASLAERNRLMLPTVFTTSEMSLQKMLDDGFGPVLASMLREAVQIYLPAGRGDTEVV